MDVRNSFSSHLLYSNSWDAIKPLWMRTSLVHGVRPYICPQCRLQARFTSPWRRVRQLATAHDPSLWLHSSKTAQRRIVDLGGQQETERQFPRWCTPLEAPQGAISTREYLGSLEEAKDSRKASLKDESARRSSTVFGRVISRRNQGGKLSFIDFESGGKSLQAVLKASSISKDQDGSLSWDLKEERRNIRRGDWIALSGVPYTTETGQDSLLVTEKPRMLAPSLQHVPDSIEDNEFLNHNRHVDRILNPSAREAITFRHDIIKTLRDFFLERAFVEVSTPLLTSQAGGAAARPFETTATEFSDVPLDLRIAPELFLKRLIVGGLEKVFEIGPAFRNEGIDATHNPEFYICEFYQMMADLETLMRMTEQLFGALVTSTHSARESMASISDPSELNLSMPFKRIHFIPALENAVRTRIPDFQFPDLSDEAEALRTLMAALSVFETSPDASTNLSLPTILDKLCSLTLEPLSTYGPLWITHHPECMSPLAKSFDSEHLSATGTPHRVSARAELFIHGREYVNCYEEENSPIEQRRKFIKQRAHQLREKPVQQQQETDKGDEVNTDAFAIDENYVRTLEWGMPPTGGWGCGVDRLVMLFSGRKRIADVLSFGTLANVVGLGSRGPGAGHRKVVKKETVSGVLDEDGL